MENKQAAIPQTNYESMYGDLASAAESVARQMLRAAMDASPFPTGDMAEMSAAYFSQQVALASALLPPLRDWSREMLEAKKP